MHIFNVYPWHMAISTHTRDAIKPFLLAMSSAYSKIILLRVWTFVHLIILK